ncbi:MAG TPA: DNA-directed RNA polymerase subunit omega [Acidimicrobiales bacterium]|nr:DNA-directed RNA polymerase subunit omega [Acidimicrobiales bacterium]
MAERTDMMTQPPIEELLDRAQSKFRLVTLSAKRARQINAYYGQLGEGLGSSIPPQVTSTARTSLSLAFQEIAADKIVAIEPAEVTEEVAAEEQGDA